MPSVLKPGQVAFIYPQEDGFANAVVPQTDDQKKLRAFIDRRHPEYGENKKHWDFLEDTYEGGREWFKENVFRYIKEGDIEYNSRVERAYRFNHTREVVDLINKYLFKQNIIRNEEDAPDSVKEFWKSATRSGLSIGNLMRQVSKKTSIFGRIGIVVDRTETVSGVSVAEEKQLGAKTYAYIVGPEQLLDYSYSADGSLNWALIEECIRDDNDPINSTGAEEERWRLWTKTEWFLFKEVKEGRKKSIVLDSRGSHNIGVVPLVLADNIISDDLYESPSMIDDIAYLDRAVANYLSNLDAIIQDQTFSQLAMPAQGVLPGEDMYAKLTEMGTKRVFLYDGESGSQPFYLSPDVKQAELILSIINKIINEIYHTVGLAGERTKQDNATGIDNSSGVAKAFDFERVNALLTSKADSLEHVENQLTLLVALWNGQYDQVKKDLVSYPDSFDTRTLFDEFDMSARLLLVEAPNTVRREQMLALVDKIFPQLAKELKDKIQQEVNNDWPPRLPEATSSLQGNLAQSELNNTGGQNAH